MHWNFKDRTGESRIMKNGLSATIIAYRSVIDIDVEFENGIIIYGAKYRYFKAETLGSRSGRKFGYKLNRQYIIEYFDEYAIVKNPINNFAFTVDSEDVENIIKYYWHTVKGYPYCAEIKMYLHQFLLKTSDGLQIDHKDQNPLNNRKNNLRKCTNAQNSRNSKIPKNNKSGYKGVSWHKASCKWRAQIGYNYKCIPLGLYHCKDEAAKAYNEAAIKYFGEFASLNKIA